MSPVAPRMPVIVGSVRRGRLSIRVARFMQRRLQEAGMEAPLLDLAEINLPIMEERLHMRDDPPPGLAPFARAVAESDGVVVVSPEYHGSIPGVLKNALDYLRGEWERKPVGIVTVSGGGFGGVQVHNHLQLLFLRLKAVPVAAVAVSNVGESFDEDGNAMEQRYEAGFVRFLDTLSWYARALSAAEAADAEASQSK